MALIKTTKNGVAHPSYWSRWLFGEVVKFSESEITIWNSEKNSTSYKGVYLGEFSFDPYGSISGQVTGFAFYFRDMSYVFFEMADLDAYAGTVFWLVQMGDLDALLAYLLVGDDVID
ncbi:MAG: hypothetical protein LPK12_13465, partial [Rhodobacterales bacterium]|nr:hypothetical protein [Rhodobacterales bacterium]MDX5500948.1 hypothetical protein [Rhodobacterales bacterium]